MPAAAAAAYSLLSKKEDAHDDPIYCCSWASVKSAEKNGPSKDYIVTGGLDTLIKVWKLDNNKLDLLHTLQGHCMAVVSLAVSPDGHTIASASLDSTLIIWELLSGNKVHEIQTGSIDVWKIAFSPDGNKIVSGSHTGKVTIYDIVNNSIDKILDTRGKFALSVAWSPNGKHIATGSVVGMVYIFDVIQCKLVHTIEAHTQTIRSVKFSPNSNLIVTASNDGSLKIFDVASGNLVSSLTLSSWVVSACFSPDGSSVAAADGTVTIATKNLKQLKTFQEHTDIVWDLDFKPDGKKLLSVGKDKTINIYETPVAKQQNT
ncbi:superkiller complex protein 8-like [Danaus plexippus]|uniref:superkiller complex protein 8-like n=1 Tax=Danaus plexippus TaxID=13037 RepID=UPI002AB1F488|nr:superkiller complex protein 8-like [Danaus plexippus]